MPDPPNRNKSNEYESRLREAELVLKTTKEIVVKFVENGRVTPSSFKDVFNVVFDVVGKAVSGYAASNLTNKNRD
jgi:hypothetical protein